jgi:hypothetical protein
VALNEEEKAVLKTNTLRLYCIQTLKMRASKKCGDARGKTPRRPPRHPRNQEYRP